MVPLSDLAEVARSNGAPLCGAARAGDLSGYAKEIGKILPGARSVVVVAAPHSRTAIGSEDVRMGQYDTIQAYGEAARASHAVALRLERKGYRARRKFPLDLVEAPPEKRRERTGGQLSLDLWQNFMTGNSYYCFACQAACPVGKMTRA